MRPLGSVAAVVAAIREDASAEADTIERQAETAIARLTAEEGDGHHAEPLERAAAVSAARERARAGAAQEDWEDTRAAIADRERWMADAAALGRQQLLGTEPAGRRRDRLARLTREGLGRLPAGPVEVVVSAADASLLDADWRAAVAAADAVSVVAGAVDGGCIVRSADGRASFDNTYAARAERLQMAWRAALAEIYQQATQALPPPDPDGSDP